MRIIDDDESEQIAYMSMVVVQQLVAKNNFCIMTVTSQNNISVLGGYSDCIEVYSITDTEVCWRRRINFRCHAYSGTDTKNVFTEIFRHHGPFVPYFQYSPY